MKRILAILASAAMICSLTACQAKKTAGTYTVTLNENPTTGYQWSYVMGEEGIIKETDDSFSEPKSTDGAVGEGGVHTWNFEALKEGTVTLTYSYEGVQNNCIAMRIVYDVTVDKDLQITATSEEIDTDCSVTEEKDMGTLVNIDGSTIEFSAGNNPGYNWSSFGQTGDDLKIVSIEDGPVAPHDDGTGNEYYFNIKGLKEGTANIGFVYHQGSDAEGIASEYDFIVTVASDLSVKIEMSAGNVDLPTNPGELVAITKDTIVLSSNPTTGYQWQVSYVNKGDDSIIRISDPDYVPYRTDLLGSGGRDTYTITGLKEGVAELEFVYGKSSAGETVTDMKLKVTVASDLSVKITQE